MVDQDTLADFIVPSCFVMPGRIAVVDDDADFRQVFLLLLARLGAVGVELGPSADLVDKIMQFKPRLVFLDLSLGTDDAVGILRSLARRGFPGKVSLVSGHDSQILDEVSSFGARNGIAMLPSVEKPVDKDKLIGVLQTATRHEGQPANSFQAKHTPPVRMNLAEALKNGWMTVWYQPQYDIATRTVCGLEALARLEHPKFGIVPPESFLGDATDEAMEELTAFVLSQVAHDSGRLGTAHGSLRISVNVPLHVMQKSNFLSLVQRLWIGPTGARPLILEVTEDGVSTELDKITDLGLQLRLYDVKLSLDDFGSEFSSFHRLRQIPFAELKLDKNYVMGCGSREDLGAICRSTVDIARHFGLQSVAEGVESLDDLQMVATAGFDIAQGYLFHRPVPLPKIMELLSEEAASSPEQNGEADLNRNFGSRSTGVSRTSC
ncbi:EAL domain-containing response regulator [Hoeflea sp. AS60]|uniref:EAL domain-containing response regulator n=1 Tax=Hoeflea sp. AS60 TaxID=3135780 RepID=UPI00316FA6D1